MLVTVDYRNRVAVVALNRPDKLNAMTFALRDALIATLQGLDADDNVGAIVLTGAGRGFSAGQDLAEAAALGPEQVARLFTHQRATCQAVRDLGKGCVAALNGVAAGAGLQLALCADLRVGHADIRIGQPEVRAGLASVVGSYLLGLHVGAGLNRQLSLTGELLGGQRAYEAGLIDMLVPPAQVLAQAVGEAEALAAAPPVALRSTRRRFRDVTQAGFDEACDAALRLAVQSYAVGEPQAVMRAFLARRSGAKL